MRLFLARLRVSSARIEIMFLFPFSIARECRDDLLWLPTVIAEPVSLTLLHFSGKQSCAAVKAVTLPFFEDGYSFPTVLRRGLRLMLHSRHFRTVVTPYVLFWRGS